MPLVLAAPLSLITALVMATTDKERLAGKGLMPTDLPQRTETFHLEHDSR